MATSETKSSVSDLIREAVGRLNVAGEVLRKRIADLCGELPLGATVPLGADILTVTDDKYPCAQYGNPAWGIRTGTARTIRYCGEIVWRDDAGYFDGNNTQCDLGAGRYCSHADLREVARQLPDALAAWIEAQHAEASQLEDAASKTVTP